MHCVNDNLYARDEHVGIFYQNLCIQKNMFLHIPLSRRNVNVKQYAKEWMSNT